MKTQLQISLIIAFLFSILLFNACAPAYTPNVVNAPLLNNKNETQISLHAGFSGTDAQIAYAATDHIGLMLNWSYRNNTFDTSSSYHYHNFIEGGVGYYTSFSSQGKFEAFAGYGYGNVDVQINNSVGTSLVQASYSRFFLQPNLGFTSQMFDVGVAPRFVYVLMKPEQFQYSTINKFFVEPTGFLRLGFKYFYLTSQAGISIPLSGYESSDWFNYNPFIFSFGMQIKLFKIYDENARYTASFF